MEYTTQNHQYFKNLPHIDDYLSELLITRKINYFDIRFAKFIVNFFNITEKTHEYLLLSLILSKETRLGHVCISIDDLLSHEIIPNTNKKDALKDLINQSTLILDLNYIKTEQFNEEFISHYPLIKLNDKIYLLKNWKYENEILKYIKNICNSEPKFNFTQDLINKLKEYIEKIFPENNSNHDIDWQKIACLMSLIKNFLIITGGPGTGKTKTISTVIFLNKLLAYFNNHELKILLCTPTGKAAKRLSESLINELHELKKKFPDENIIKLIDTIPCDAQTIHRLLGYNPTNESYKYNEENKLDADLLIVDETSMIDLELLFNLIKAIPHNSKLILVGDKNQLSSIETGSIFSDLCDVVNEITHYSHETCMFLNNFHKNDLRSLNFMKSPNKLLSLANKIQDATIILKKNYRFPPTSGIYHLSNAINNGDIKQVREILLSNKYKDIQYYKLTLENLITVLKDDIIELYKKIQNTNDSTTVLELINTIKILSPIREGLFGVVYLNDQIESILVNENIINDNSSLYHGKPIIITENDYILRLFNGDIGVILHNPQDNNHLAYFHTSEKKISSFSPLKLPKYETVYAMTIHKSQGSDFDHIIIVIPDVTDDKILNKIYTRELLYTAITRAKKDIKLIANIETIEKIVQQKTKKISGFTERIKNEQIF